MHFITSTFRYSFISFLLVTLVACDSGQRLDTSQLDDFARFGRSVDIMGFSAVVGAYQESNGAAEGAAYVFSRRDDSWSIQARLESPAPGDEQFGNAVAIAGNIVAVGAPLDNRPGAIRAGSVYLYQRDTDGQWSHFQTLGSLFSQAWEAYGISVALDGDLLVVGAVDRDQGAATDAGAAFIYELNGGVFNLIASLAAPSPAAFDKFGSRVEIIGNTVAISALRRDLPNAEDAGAVYIYERSGGSFSLAQTLTANDAAEDDIFGTGLALFQEAGARRLVVGAEGVDLNGNSNVGAAYVFDAPSGGAFAQTAKLEASDGSSFDIFGTDVGLWSSTIIVGASGVDDSAIGSGAAYIFQLSGGVWSEESKLSRSSSDANAFLGSAVDIWGAAHVLAGATGDEISIGLSDTGSVQAFRRTSPGSWEPSHVLTAAGSVRGDRYGRTLSANGDHLIVSSSNRADLYRADLDAYSLQQTFNVQPSGQIQSASVSGDTAALFAKRFDPAFPVGYIEVFTEQNGEWQQQQLIEPDLVSASFPLESANNGLVLVDGDRLVVGARRWNGGDGRVFYYQRSGGVWGLQQMMTSSQAMGNFDMNYGNAIALDGDWLAVSEVPSGGVPGSPRNGNVFIYQLIDGQFVEQQVLSEAIPSPFDGFGRALSMNGDLLSVYGTNSSTVRVYQRINGVYTEIWSQAIAGVADTALTNNQLAIGLPSTDFDGTIGGGEVRIFERQPDDSYVEDQTFRAPDPIDGLSLGATVILTPEDVIASSYTSVVSTRVYVFER